MPLNSEQKLKAEVDWAKRSDEWLGFKHIKPITKEQLKTGAGPIEFLPSNILKSPEVASCSENSAQTVKSGVFPFGKYKGKTFEWVKENDESYWSWAKENINLIKKQ